MRRTMNVRVVRVFVFAVLSATLPLGCAKRHTTVTITTPAVRGKFLDDTTLLFHIKDGRRDYHALFGATDSTRPVRAYVRQSQVMVGSDYGWIYIFGLYPRGETELVNASATGTTFIIGSYDDRSRVVFLCADHGEGVQVTSKKRVDTGSDSRTLTEPWHYVDAFRRADGAVEFSAFKPVPKPGEADPDGARELVERVKRAVDDRGLGGWCSQPGAPSTSPTMQ